MRASDVNLEEDPESDVRGAAASDQVPGLTEIGVGGGKLGCLGLGEAELTKLLCAPAEDGVLLAQLKQLFPCGAARHPLVERRPGR